MISRELQSLENVIIFLKSHMYIHVWSHTYWKLFSRITCPSSKEDEDLVHHPPAQYSNEKMTGSLKLQVRYTVWIKNVTSKYPHSKQYFSKKFFFCFACRNVYAPWVWLVVPVEARRGRWSHGDWSYRSVWALK